MPKQLNFEWYARMWVWLMRSLLLAKRALCQESPPDPFHRDPSALDREYMHLSEKINFPRARNIVFFSFAIDLTFVHIVAECLLFANVYLETPD